MSRAERREQILDVATAVFAENGYAGATTDQIARAARVSQPYVVRIFGTKEDLFREVLDGVTAEILACFEAVPPGPRAKEEMGEAYSQFVADPDKLRVVLHAFALGSDPKLGARARDVLARVFDLYLRRTGGTQEEARQFLADGMLLNVLYAVHAPEHTRDDPRIEALVGCYPAVTLAASHDDSTDGSTDSSADGSTDSSVDGSTDSRTADREPESAGAASVAGGSR